MHDGTLKTEAVAFAVKTSEFHFVWIPASQLLDVWDDSYMRIVGSAELDTEHNRVWIESYTEISEYC